MKFGDSINALDLACCRAMYCALAAAMLALCAAPAACAESLEVHEFEPHAAQHLGQQRTVLGRFKSANAQRMLLVDSQIEFRLSKNAGRIGSNLKHVEITGHLSQQGQGWTFAVERLSPARSETEVFNDRRRSILTGDYRRLYDLCAWLRKRAAWYQDDALTRLAAENYRQAFGWEEDAAVKAQDIAGLRELADRGESLGLAAAECDRIRHRAHWEKLRQTSSDAEPELRKLAEEVAALWPAAATAGDAWSSDNEQQVQEYLADPATAYAGAGAEQRTLLRRALWVEIMGRALEAAARADATRLAELAQEAADRLPERPEWNHRLRLQEARRLARAPQQLIRGKAVNLAKELTELGQGDEAQRMLSQWLGQRRRNLDVDDAEGHAQMAADYREFLQDDAAAAQLYLQALRAAPNFTAAETALQSLGYRRVAGAWQRQTQPAAGEENAAEPEQRGVRPGDTEQEVIRRLRKPDRIARTLSAGYLSELWIYDGPPRLHIYLKRSPGSQTARVVSLAAP